MFNSGPVRSGAILIYREAVIIMGCRGIIFAATVREVSIHTGGQPPAGM